MSTLTKEEVIEYDRKYNQHPWHKGGIKALPIERAEGIYYWDYDGNRYYDMASQLSNVNLGHANPEINQAITDQLQKLAYINPAKASAPRSELAKQLVEIAPDNIAKVFFTNAGADANEAAIYAARAFTGRSKILTRYRSYHGATYGSINLSGDPRRLSREKPAAPGFLKFFDPYVYHSTIPFSSDQEASEYYLHLLEEQIIYEGPESIAAVEIEAITGANGVIIPPDGYLEGLRKLTRKYGILLICDEVMTGFYRTGKAFAFQNWGIEPDIISFAKGVTSGYIQLGGILISKEIADFFEKYPFNFGLTY
ncbi:MAG: aminotransferase class III-fold pyridoxal phosphate-dependent enzyme, partial [Eubacterium sp.]